MAENKAILNLDVSDVELTFIANAGVLLSGGHETVLIDGLYGYCMEPFESMTSRHIERIRANVQPFRGVDHLLVTHEHEDHFDGEVISKYLEFHPNTQLYSTDIVVSCVRRLANKSVNGDRLHFYEESDISKYHEVALSDGIKVKIFNLPHDGDVYSHVYNIGFLVDYYGVRVFHGGDAKPDPEVFSLLQNHTIDIGILNFTYLTLAGGRKIVEEFLKMKQTYYLHLPARSEDRQGWISAVEKKVNKYTDMGEDIVLCLNG